MIKIGAVECKWVIECDCWYDTDDDDVDNDCCVIDYDDDDDDDHDFVYDDR